MDFFRFFKCTLVFVFLACAEQASCEEFSPQTDSTQINIDDFRCNRSCRCTRRCCCCPRPPSCTCDSSDNCTLDFFDSIAVEFSVIAANLPNFITGDLVINLSLSDPCGNNI